MSDKITQEQARKLNQLSTNYKYSNENTKKAQYNKFSRNKSLGISISSNNDEQFIDKMCEPIPRKKTVLKQKIERICHYTKKPVDTFNGLLNPIKLNISNNTLNKLKTIEVNL